MAEIHDKIQKLHPEDLIPYHNNPKEHPDEQIDKIASSIKEYGFIQPIVISEDNTIIIGHGRIKAAKKLGLEEVPVINADDLTEAQAKALRLADNRIAETGWDEEKLGVELENLDEEDFDMALTGFDEDELSQFHDEQAEVEEDGYSEDPETVDTDIKEGEVFKLGRHRLMCGDATNEEHVQLLMDGEKADIIITDPPYGVHNSDKAEFLNEQMGGNRNTDKVGSDDKKSEVLKEELWSPALRIAYDACSEGAPLYCFAPQGGDQMMMMSVVAADFNEKMHQLVWIKNNHALGRSDYDYKHEPVIYTWKGTGHNWYGGHKTSLLEFDRSNKNEHHPTQKPIKLISELITNSSKQDDVILDLFGGSGSTLIAAEQTNRQCFMMELDPQYCQVIINRWEQFTGMEAEKVVNVE